MNGQWVGPLEGTNKGLVFVDLDDLGSHYAGVACFFDDQTDQPAVFAQIVSPGKEKRFSVRLRLFPMHPETQEPVDWNHISGMFPPGSSFPTYADSEWEVLDEQWIRVKYKSDIGTEGAVVLRASKAGEPSQLSAQKPVSWDRFRTMATKFEPYRFVFRGQSDSSWRLRTRFHRTGRADLSRFVSLDMAELYNLISNHTPHLFDRTKPEQNAAFFSLAQHHGYPTPLLDWTHSPFVAAFFAFRGLVQKPKRGATVRIFVLDRKAWESDYVRIEKISPALPHFTILNILGLNNPRLLPQQAVLGVTNIDDIEMLIRTREERQNRTYLKAIDLRAADRTKAMQQLALMGITAGSLFPGLDGACEQLRERMFGI